MRRVALVIALVVTLAASSAATPARAIVGGTGASTASYPWMASLQLNNSHRCGGTVVRARWVLTAAHCVANGKATGLTVVLGRTSLSSTAGKRITVDQVRVHPGYKASSMTNDVALLHLTRDAGVQRLVLSGSGDNALEAAGRPVRATGWGDTTGSGVAANDRLMQVDLQMVSDSSCAQSYSIDATMLCASALLKDTCQGDSGGPLFAYRNGSPIQIGITSHGFHCAVPSFPGVYTEVNSTSVRSFIRTVAGI